MNNKKKITLAILLLITLLMILKLFLGGPYLYNLLEELISITIILNIISLIMMIVPFILSLKNKSRLEYKKGKKVCFTNSLIIYLLSTIPFLNTIIKGNDNTQVLSFDPVVFAKQLIIIFLIIAIIYYFINMLLFVESKKTPKKWFA